ncbi:hypoxanthine phosphoribosyltransferase [Limosilactobacillus equigenerosi DSM 18793 = JCM 14505]|uniref:Hypoxanthine phosphoribosyltransferase n=2 Tax=Limosilactobacillus TaxID=2742598 RepID=A0A0R1UXD0_9LACO|nr:hypoxanthine phosphoribosyltransferase [Limosilactobacillus equigenerosi DSM 18793 = JCM 14505]
MSMENDIERVLYSEADIQKLVNKLADQINHDYADTDELVVVSVLTGAMMFTTDLFKRIKVMASLDSVDLSSYAGATTESTGTVELIQDLTNSIEGKDVLVVEDIVDTGRTLAKLVDVLKDRGAKSLKICTLFDKPDRRVADVKADYVGQIVPNEFIVGYGLDYNFLYRNLPYVGVLKPEVYR